MTHEKGIKALIEAGERLAARDRFDALWAKYKEASNETDVH